MSRPDDHPRTDPQIDRWWLMFCVGLGIVCALYLAWAFTRPGAFTILAICLT